MTATNAPTEFSLTYEKILRAALYSSCYRNKRTGEDIFTIRGGTTFQVDLSDGLLPLIRLRKTHLKSAAAEVAWFLMGTKDVTWMAKHAPFWDKFTEADGVTIANAYGYRWANHFGRDQLRDAIMALNIDPGDRRVYISTWDPANDGLGRPGKNVPCPVGFTLSILNGELHSSMLIRSSDLFVGLPYDVLGHALLLSAVSQTLGIRPGVMTFVLAHPHLYAKHRGMAETGLQSVLHQPRVPFPVAMLADIVGHPDAYVEQLLKLGHDELTKVLYNPRPEIIP